MLEGGCDLVDLLHAGAHGTAADEDENIAGLNALRPVALDGGNGLPLAGEDARRTSLAVDAAGIDDGWINGGALDNRAFRSKVAARERHGGSQPAGPGLFRTHDDIVGIHAILAGQHLPESPAAFGLFPPVENLAERLACDSQAIFVKQAK